MNVMNSSKYGWTDPLIGPDWIECFLCKNLKLDLMGPGGSSSTLGSSTDATSRCSPGTVFTHYGASSPRRPRRLHLFYLALHWSFHSIVVIFWMPRSHFDLDMGSLCPPGLCSHLSPLCPPFHPGDLQVNRVHHFHLRSRSKESKQVYIA